MRLLEDDRGVSPVIAIMFIVFFAVIGLSVNQAEFVPNENKKVEFQHSQEVADQMVGVRNAILNTATTNETRAQRVTLGVDYPARVFAENAGPAAGTLRTADPGGVSTPQLELRNVQATDSEVADYWDGSTTRTYTTKEIEYQPGYNYFTSAPSIHYENTVLYKEGPNGGISVQTGQQLVDGTTLDLTTLQGELSKSTTGSVTVDTGTPAGGTRVIQVEDGAAGPITIIIPSSLSESKWKNEILASEFDGSDSNPDKYIDSIGPGPEPNEVEITLEQDETYNFRVPVTSVGPGSVSVGGRAYLTGISGGGTSIPEGSTGKLTVEVRNKFNGPVPGEDLCAEVTGRNDDVGSASVDSPATSDENGRATVTYSAPSNVDNSQSAEIQVSYDCSGGTPDPSPNQDDKDQVLFDVTVSDSDGSGSGGGGGSGGNSAFSIDWKDPSGEPGTQSSCSETDCTWDVSSDSDDILTLTASTDPSIDGIDVNFALNSTTSSGTIDSQDGQTGSTGEASMDLKAQSNGGVSVYVASGGASDVINISISGVSGDPGPPGSLAYDDANNNGAYDSGETTYTKSEIESGLDKQSEDIIIPSDVGTLDLGGNEIKTNSLELNTGINSPSQVKLTIQETLDFSDQTIKTTGNKQIQIKAGQSGSGDIIATNANIDSGGQVKFTTADKIDFTGTTITASGSSQISLKAGTSGSGQLIATNGDISTNGQVKLESNGDMYVDGATISAGNGKSASATLNTDSATIYVDGLVVNDKDDDLNYSPNGATVSGSPSSGTVS